MQWANNELELFESKLVVEDCLPNIRTHGKRKMTCETAVDNSPTITISKFETEIHNVAMDCITNKIEESFSNTREICRFGLFGSL